jgi:transketolase
LKRIQFEPIDEKTIRQAADESGALVTVEDRYLEGGLGAAVLNVIARRKLNIDSP